MVDAAHPDPILTAEQVDEIRRDDGTITTLDDWWRVAASHEALRAERDYWREQAEILESALEQDRG